MAEELTKDLSVRGHLLRAQDVKEDSADFDVKSLMLEMLRTTRMMRWRGQGLPVRQSERQNKQITTAFRE